MGNKEKFKWLSYSKENNWLKVEKEATTEDDIGEYTLDLILSDGYKFGPNEQLYFLKIIVDIPARPFFVLEPKNEAPVFTTELPTEEL